MLLPTACALALSFAPQDGEGLPDWNQWRGADGSGLCAEVDWEAKGKVEPRWQRDVGLGYSSVCLSSGILVTIGFDRAASQDVIQALDPMSGEERWRHSYPAELADNMHEGGSLTTPVAEGDTVFVLSRMGTLWALALSDGEVRWSVDLGKEHGVETGFFGLCASPAIVPEGLLINVGKTILIDKASGKSKWATEDYGYSYSTPVPFRLKDQECLAVFNAKGLAVLERDGGGERSLFPWTSKYNVNCAAPIPIGTKLFLSTGFDDKGCAMLELSGDEPEVLWQSKAMRNKMTGSVLWNDVLYGFDTSLFKALDLEGKTLWKERGLGNGAFRLCRDGRVLILSEEGEFVTAKVSNEGFEELTRQRLFDEGKCWTSPVLSGGLVFCRSSRGQLACLDLRKAATER